MFSHDFIFKPGLWIGEGKVTFSASPEVLRFYTKWTVEKEKDQEIVCLQQVEMGQGESNLFNKFVFSHILSTSFQVELTSELLGTVQGKGIMDSKMIAWEFHGHAEFEGVEVYQMQDNGDYLLHAEYSSVDQFRTIIDGRIWKKAVS